jgi:hypothetical protein
VALLVTAVCLSFSASDAAIAPTEPLLVQQSGAKKKDKENDKTIPSNCSRDSFPITVDGVKKEPLSCCQEGGRTYHTNDGKTLAIRVLGAPCTEADGKGVNCEGRQDDPQTCAYGPCGAKKEFVVTAVKVHIFKPNVEHHGKPKKCGWTVNQFIECRLGDCKDWTKDSDHSDPETFDGHKHKEYGGVKPRCRFNGCAKGGKPIP